MKRYANLHPHEPHGLTGLLRWKLGFRSRKERKRAREEYLDGSETLDETVSEASPVEPDWSKLHHPSPELIQVTWIGHASFLVQMNGRNVLFDPVYSTYCSPVPWPGTRRIHPPGIPFAKLPAIDAVFISHSHYDHLDRATVRRLGAEPRYVVPAGLKSWFAAMGIDQVTELAWWDAVEVFEGFWVTCTPAQHFSARTWLDRNRTLWCGWVVRAAAGKVYFAGDTGYCPSFAEIGRRLGPLSVSMIPIGSYEPRFFMKPMHVNPFEAVQVHLDVRSQLSVASHWGVFPMTDEPLREPPRLLRRALRDRNVASGDFRIPRIGETISRPVAMQGRDCHTVSR